MIYKKTKTWTRLPSKLPEDLVVQILSWLHPKSLMRFKCVCKSWNSLTTCPAFVAMHLSNSKRNSILPTCVLSLERTNYKTPGIRELSYFVYSMRSLGNGPHNPEDNACEDIGIRFPFDNLRGPQFIGHCDWMICLTDWRRNNIFLLNPAINQRKLLPRIPLPHPPYRHGNNHVSLGFGYDPKFDDCKVISIARLFYNEYLDGRCVANPPKVDVYTLGADSWGQLLNIDDYLQTEMTVFSPENLQWCFNGVCYGMASEHPKEYRSVYEVNRSDWIRKVIVSFDLDKEVFRAIQLSGSWEEEPQDPDHLLPGLGVFQLRQWNDESIAMYNFGHDKSLEMWVMDDHGGSAGGGKVTWIKHFTFDPTKEIIRAASSCSATFWKNYENLFMVSEDGQYISYNIRTKERELEYFTPHYENRHESMQATVFLPSIVSVVSRRYQVGTQTYYFFQLFRRTNLTEVVLAST